jgi:anthranilate synthase component II
MLLLIDNFDSFSHMLADLILQTGQELKIVRNDVSVESLQDLPFDGLILSPGPGRPATSGNLMQILETFHQTKPILGVCLGHQAIGEFFGAKLIKNDQPTHGKVRMVFRHQSHPCLDGLPDEFSVTRYHSLQLTDLPEALSPLLKTKKGEIMAIAHTYLPIFGIQYHPEALLTEYGLEIIQNWLQWADLEVKQESQFI